MGRLKCLLKWCAALYLIVLVSLLGGGPGLAQDLPSKPKFPDGQLTENLVKVFARDPRINDRISTQTMALERNLEYQHRSTR